MQSRSLCNALKQIISQPYEIALELELQVFISRLTYLLTFVFQIEGLHDPAVHNCTIQLFFFGDKQFEKYINKQICLQRTWPSYSHPVRVQDKKQELFILTTINYYESVTYLAQENTKKEQKAVGIVTSHTVRATDT